MQKHRFAYRLFAFSMAFWMSFLSFGVVVDMHFCGGELKSLNFFGEAEKCDMAQGDHVGCPHHASSNEKELAHSCCHKKKQASEIKKSSRDKKGCCHNESFRFELDEDFTFDDAFELDWTSHDLKICAEPIVLLSEQYVYTAESISMEPPSPPLIKKDILVDVQCFRI